MGSMLIEYGDPRHADGDGDTYRTDGDGDPDIPMEVGVPDVPMQMGISYIYYYIIYYNIVVVLSRIFQVVTVVIYDYFCIGFMLSHYFP